MLLYSIVLTHQSIVFIVGRKLNVLFHGVLAGLELTTFRLWLFKLYEAGSTVHQAVMHPSKARAGGVSFGM